MDLLVTGGNGFIGREVCRRAVAGGDDVTSVGRRGRPDPEYRGPWAAEVTWVAADVFEPHRWRRHLEGVDAVVHCVGIARERPNQGATFERVNGDAAILVALEAERAGADRFVFLSSSVSPPLVREEYVKSKRRAEAAVADLDVETAVVRPGPVYGPDQPHFPRPVAAALRFVDGRETLARQFEDDRPLSVETVGRAIYDAARGDAPAMLDAIAMGERYG